MKLLLAPMAAISHEALRRTIARFGGCDEYYTEMIHASSFINGGPYERYYGSCEPERKKTVWQLTGSAVPELVRCTELLMQSECSSSVIGFDINMGCPAPEIYRQGAGIAWMSKPPEQVEAMLCAVRRACEQKRLSVKIRLGEENFTLQGLLDFADMLCSSGVERITLHPRTRKERYARAPKRQYVQLLAEFVHSRYPDVSVAGNGAIDGDETLASFAAQCPLADSFMIGRAAVQKPWIFSVLKRSRDEKDLRRKAQSAQNAQNSHTLTIDLLQVAQDFIEDLKECQPEDFYKTRAQRFFAYYCDNFQFAHYLKSRILHQDSLEAMLDTLKQYFDKMPEERVLKQSFFADT